jgi:ribosomal protein S19
MSDVSIANKFKVPTSFRKLRFPNPEIVGSSNATSSLPIVRAAPGQKSPPVKTQARSATILPNFVGLKFQVHNGKIYHDVTITEDMVGHKLGEFSPWVLYRVVDP